MYDSLYWINLTKRNDRRLHMLEQFEKNDIRKHIRINGILNNNKRIACMLSHIEALYTSWLDGHDIVLITEDDIILDNLNLYEPIIKLLPNDWDCFKMHYTCPILLKELKKLNFKYDNCFLKGYFSSAGCYMYNRKGLEKFLNKMGKFDENGNYVLTCTFTENAIAEELIFHYVNTYSLLYPLVNTNENFGSDIQPKEHSSYGYESMLIIKEIPEKKFMNKVINVPENIHDFYNIEINYYIILYLLYTFRICNMILINYTIFYMEIQTLNYYLAK